jgi:hypothetical protein
MSNHPKHSPHLNSYLLQVHSIDSFIHLINTITMQLKQSLLAAALSATTVSAFSIPSNVQAFYNNHKSNCTNRLQGGFTDGNSKATTMEYCGDTLHSNHAIFLHLTSGNYAGMNIDCDGVDRRGGSLLPSSLFPLVYHLNKRLGACSNDPTGQDQTAFADTVKSYNAGISDLNANIHPYVVFGNSGKSPSFDPQHFGMQPLSVMAIICNGQMHYGIWGDVNGATSTGEVSLSLGELCFPNSGLSGNNGYDGHDILYVGFIGNGTVPGKNGAKWNAKSGSEFEQSIKGIGDKLVANL